LELSLVDEPESLLLEFTELVLTDVVLAELEDEVLDEEPEELDTELLLERDDSEELLDSSAISAENIIPSAVETPHALPLGFCEVTAISSDVLCADVGSSESLLMIPI